MPLHLIIFTRYAKSQPELVYTGNTDAGVEG